MMLDLDPDGLLTTTRAVRKRLDLTRPVERPVIEACLSIATQAPTGSNSQGWQWVVIEDPALKQGIADLYGRHYDEYQRNPRSASYAEGDPRAERREKVTASSRYLREHLHEVPLLLIPCIEGRLGPGTSTFQQASATWRPPPSAGPWIAAMVGTGSSCQT